MSEPLFHAPTAHHALVDVIFTVAGALFDLGGRLLLREPPKLRRRFWLLPLVLVVPDVTRDWLAWPVTCLYIWWFYWGRDLPWDKWRKGALSTATGLTDVVMNAFRGEQAEAFRAEMAARMGR